MKAYDRSQLLRQCKDDMIVFCVQQFLPSLLEPGCCVILMALWTASIATGVITVVLIATLITLENMAAHDCCTAVQYICKGPLLAGQHLLAEPLQIPISVTAQNIRDFEHGWTPRSSELVHQVIDLAVNTQHGILGQVHIHEGGFGIGMAQQRLDHPQVHALFHKMGGVGMPQRDDSST